MMLEMKKDKSVLGVTKIQKIFSATDVKYGLSLFKNEEIEAIEKLIVEQNERFYIKCQVKDKYKLAKPEEIVRQLWVYRLLNGDGYPSGPI